MDEITDSPETHPGSEPNKAAEDTEKTAPENGGAETKGSYVDVDKLLDRISYVHGKTAVQTEQTDEAESGSDIGEEDIPEPPKEPKPNPAGIYYRKTLAKINGTVPDIPTADGSIGEQIIIPISEPPVKPSTAPPPRPEATPAAEDDEEDDSDDELTFRLPKKPPENYISVLNMRNAALAEEDKKNPPPPFETVFGFCGTECSECEYYIGSKTARGDSGIGCRGCRAEGGDCDIRVCCLSKSIKQCGDCDVFPCDMLKRSSEEEDGENLFRMKAEHDLKEDARLKLTMSYTWGIVGGTAGGLLFSAVTGLFPQLLICGLAVGITVALLINMKNTKK